MDKTAIHHPDDCNMLVVADMSPNQTTVKAFGIYKRCCAISHYIFITFTETALHHHHINQCHRHYIIITLIKVIGITSSSHSSQSLELHNLHPHMHHSHGRHQLHHLNHHQVTAGYPASGSPVMSRFLLWYEIIYCQLL